MQFSMVQFILSLIVFWSIIAVVAGLVFGRGVRRSKGARLSTYAHTKPSDESARQAVEGQEVA